MTRSVTVTDLAGNSATFETSPVSIDRTAPLVTPQITGTLGNNGWYTSDVRVEWSVNELLASLVATSGCDTQNVTADTAGVSFTCMATSAGGSTTQFVTLKRDATPPVLTFGTPSPAPNANGWNKTNVSIPFTRSDALSGLASTSATSPLVFSTEGADLTRAGRGHRQCRQQRHVHERAAQHRQDRALRRDGVSGRWRDLRLLSGRGCRLRLQRHLTGELHGADRRRAS